VDVIRYAIAFSVLTKWFWKE